MGGICPLFHKEGFLGANQVQEKLASQALVNINIIFYFVWFSYNRNSRLQINPHDMHIYWRQAGCYMIVPDLLIAAYIHMDGCREG